MTSRTINGMANEDIYFKCENFQKGGTYKIRGASHSVLRLTDAHRDRGVVTLSSGKFAQALSLAANCASADAYIVIYSPAPQVKKDAVAEYGGKIIECEPTLVARETAARKIERENGATLIHPSNDENVIIGKGTAAMELLEDYLDLEVLIVPVGGGGLITGTGLAAFFS